MGTGEARKGYWLPEAGVRDTCELPHMGAGIPPNTGALEEQCVALKHWGH